MATRTVVTGLITNAAGNPATSGYVDFILQPQSNSQLYYVVGTEVVAPPRVRATINASGQVKAEDGTSPLQLWGNGTLNPTNTWYKVVIAPEGRVSQTVNLMLIDGGAYDLANPVFFEPGAVEPNRQEPHFQAIESDIIPAADNAFWLGNAQKRYAGGYINQLFVQSITGPQFSYAPVNVFSFMTDAQIVDVMAFTYGLDVSSAIQAAINSLPAGGGTILFPSGGYRVQSTITIGNGSVGVASTRNGVKLIGLAGSWFIDANGPVHNGGVVIKMYGAAHAGAVIQLNGQVYNCRLESLSIQYHTDVGSNCIGIYNLGGSGITYNDIAVIDPPNFGLVEYTQGLTGGARNKGTNLLFFLGHANSQGLLSSANPAVSSADRAFDEYSNILVIPTLASQTGIQISYADSIKISNYTCYSTGVGACTALHFNYSNYALFPNGCVLWGYDPFDNNTINTGTNGVDVPAPGITSFQNYVNRIYAFSQDNGAPIPSLANLKIINDGAPQSQGVTGSISSGATVTHNLGFTPTVIFLQPYDATPTAWFPSSIGGTTFAITFSGGGSHVFAWKAQ